MERVWSLCKYIEPDHRRQMTPQLFESFPFLKFNELFWNAKLEAVAIQNAKADGMNA